MIKKTITISTLVLLTLAIAGGFWFAQNGGGEVGIAKKNTNTKIAPPINATPPIPATQKEIAQDEKFEIDTSNWKTYVNEEIGISFSYPSEWGAIKQWIDTGCFDENGNMVDDNNLSTPCKHIALQSENAGIGLFLATETQTYTKYFHPRDGYFGDNSGIIDDEFVGNPCFVVKKITKTIIDCKSFITTNNITVAKNIEQVPFAENGEIISVYYIKSPNQLYKGIIISPNRLPYNKMVSDYIIKELINTLKFL